MNVIDAKNFIGLGCFGEISRPVGVANKGKWCLKIVATGSAERCGYLLKAQIPRRS